MRNFMIFLMTAILAVGFTLIFGLADNANAKTAFLGYGAASSSPNGDYSNYGFEGMSFGAGARFGMGNRFSFGLDYTRQGISRSGWEYGQTSAWNGKSVVGVAEIYDMDISAFGIPFDEDYLLAYSKESKSGAFNLITGAFYISLLPENGNSRRVIEPVIGLIAGAVVIQDNTESEYYYHEVIEYLIPGVLDPRSGFLFDGDDGSHRGRNTMHKESVIAGLSLGLNLYPVEHLIFAPEIRVVVGKDFGPYILPRIGFGATF
jgi:hypothetical protein